MASTSIRVLSINANCGADQDKPARQVIDDAVAELAQEHASGILMVQEYRFKGGSAFSRFTPLRDLLPGGWRRWKVAQLEFEGGGMVPLVLWDDALFDGSAVKLGPANPPPTPGSVRHKGAVEEPFAGRYTAVLLSCRTSPGKELGAKLLAISYHGQQFQPSPAKDSPPRELSEEQKLANAQRFVELVGLAVARMGVPAVVAGDWATSFGFESKPLPTSEEWQAQLRPVAIYHPSELACYRYRNSKAPVDFLAIVNPVPPDGSVQERDFTVEAAGVTAVAHPEELQCFFDHDPLLASVSISTGMEAIIPPLPLESVASSAPAAPRHASPAAGPKTKHTPSARPSLHAQMGSLAQRNDELQQQLVWLRQEACAGGSSAAGASEQADGGARLCLEGSGSTGAASDCGEAAGEGEWQSLVSQLVSELSLVKESSGKLLQLVEQKDHIIASLQAKLRGIAEQAANAAALPAATAGDAEALDSLPVALLQSPPGAQAPAGGEVHPLTPEPSVYLEAGWRTSPAGSTNGR